MVGSVQLSAPSLGMVALHVARHARNPMYALDQSGDYGRVLASKAIGVMQADSADGFVSDPAYSNATQTWFARLSSSSAYFALLARNIMARAPFNSGIGVSAGGAIGYLPGGALPAPLGHISVDREQFRPLVAMSFVGVTEELVTAAGAGGADLIDRELSDAIGRVVDGSVYDSLSTSVNGGAVASGTDAGACMRDLRAALKNTFGPGQSAGRGVWIADPAVAIDLCTLAQKDGGPALFPDLGPNGGTLLGLPFFTSSGWGSGALTLLDGSQAVGQADAVGLGASRNTAYEAAAVPQSDGATGQGASLVSAFQSYSMLLRCITRFAFALARDSSAYTISGCAYETASGV